MRILYRKVLVVLYCKYLKARCMWLSSVNAKVKASAMLLFFISNMNNLSPLPSLSAVITEVRNRKTTAVFITLLLLQNNRYFQYKYTILLIATL